MTSHYLRWYSVIEDNTDGHDMSDIHPAIQVQDEPAFYEIRLKGHLANRWAEWFGDVAIGLEEDGTTRLTCPVVDQAALYGLLKKLHTWDCRCCRSIVLNLARLMEVRDVYAESLHCRSVRKTRPVHGAARAGPGL